MLNQPTINECKNGYSWKIIKTGKGYLFAVYREEKDKILNIAETDNFTKALQFEKSIGKNKDLLEFGLKLKENIERRLDGKEENTSN